jgi:hypothetical protein
MTFILPLLLLITAVLLFFNKMAFSNLILARGDTFLYFYPYWQTAADALRAGHIPLWNPMIFMGVPFMANSQAGLFYPLNWPLWLLLQTPYATSASIVIHLIIAGTGTFLLARNRLELSWPAALLAGLAFALSGYFTAQVEHINQVQGLAWLPWFLWVMGGIVGREWRDWLRGVAGLALLFALQVLAGHTQTTFITGVALLIWITAVALGERLRGTPAQADGPWVRRFTALAAAGMLALLITAVQLLPTLELAGLSSRQGGLPPNEVMSFSLPPLLLTRALLPAYGQSLFSEYVAFLPLTFLALAFIGGWGWRRRPVLFAALALALLGLFLALGVFNPLYWLLARLPGFDLFRAPARWLVLYALGLSLLAGVGWQVLADALRNDTAVARIKRPLIWFAVTMVLLMVWGWLAGYLAGVLPTGSEAPFEAPAPATFAGWMVELLALLVLLATLPLARSRQLGDLWLTAVAVLGMTGLFLASRALPYNNLTTPEAYFDLRPSTTRLLAAGGMPPDRFLSLSDIFFDPGDQAEIDTIYAGQLSEQARYDYTIAIKQKEIIAPNLPIVYGLASVDGFDGGILPLRSYSNHAAWVLPQGAQTTDGRLREQLDAVPDEQWLDLVNARYLITDKVGDEWRDGVFYDRQHQVTLAPGGGITVGHVPPFAGTELRLLATGQPAQVAITSAAGATAVIETEALGNDLYRAKFPQPGSLQDVTVSGCRGVPCTLQAITMVDTRDGTFVTLSPGNYRQIHSGDVKIYENLDVQPRAFLLSDWQWVEDNAAADEIMREALFDPRATAVLVRPPGAGAVLPVPGQARGAQPGTAGITRYTAEEVLIHTNSDADTMLLLTDAAYPGWSAGVDGRETPIYTADGLFRAVFVPAGSHEVRFVFAPRSFEYGRLLSLVGLVLLTGLGGYLWLSRSKNRS